MKSRQSRQSTPRTFAATQTTPRHSHSQCTPIQARCIKCTPMTTRRIPHISQADVNRCAITLNVRYPQAYPRQPVQLHLQQAKGLPAAWVRNAASQLQQAASDYAANGEVCVFNLVERCQELLRMHNDAPPPTAEVHAPVVLCIMHIPRRPLAPRSPWSVPTAPGRHAQQRPCLTTSPRLPLWELRAPVPPPAPPPPRCPPAPSRSRAPGCSRPPSHRSCTASAPSPGRSVRWRCPGHFDACLQVGRIAA